MQNEMPHLAQYRRLADYVPAYGDYVVWSGWFTTWHGIVSNYDNKSNDLYVIFSGIPLLLFTMSEEEQKVDTKTINLLKIKNAPQGKWAIQQHDRTRNAIIWYI
jgi:hypothetical protein